jgi:hypothetical protein
MVLKVTEPVVVLPLVGLKRAFAECPSICAAHADSKTTAQKIMVLFILGPQFGRSGFVTLDRDQDKL